MRSVTFHYPDFMALAAALAIADEELRLPDDETVSDGEWVLAVFEIGDGHDATATAARGLDGDEGGLLIFERRDWKRLIAFARDEGIAPSLPAPMNEAHDTIPPHDTLPPSSPFAPPSESMSAATSNSWKVPVASMRNDDAAPSRLLLVDDDADVRDLVGAMLEAVGLVVEVAESAEDALERIRREPFDLFVLDWMLPGMSGLDLCRNLRNDVAIAGTPILFLSAHASSRDVVDAFASGADDFVAKPFRAPELGARIFGLLRRARMARVTAPSA